MARRFNVYDTIAMMRSRPSMYLGECSLVRLNAFLNGCFFVAHEFGIGYEVQPDFGDFRNWVAQRFNRLESTAGYCSIILHECGGDDRQALDLFFELIEEYRRTFSPGAANFDS